MRQPLSSEVNEMPTVVQVANLPKAEEERKG